MTKHLQSWVNHVKQWANSHNVKYGQALKSVECRENYKKGSSGDESQVEEVKPKRKYVRKSKIVEPPELPKEVLQVIQKRKYTRRAPPSV